MRRVDFLDRRDALDGLIDRGLRRLGGLRLRSGLYVCKGFGCLRLVGNRRFVGHIRRLRLDFRLGFSVGVGCLGGLDGHRHFGLTRIDGRLGDGRCLSPWHGRGCLGFVRVRATERDRKEVALLVLCPRLIDRDVASTCGLQRVAAIGLLGLTPRVASIVTNDVLFAHGSYLGRHLAELSAETA